MKSLIIYLAIAALLSPAAFAQTKKTTVKTLKKTTRKKVVRKVKKVRIYRSILDLLYIPKTRQIKVSTGVEVNNRTSTYDYFVPPNSQLQQVFAEEKKHNQATGFLSFDYAISKGFIVGAKISNNFTNTIESENTNNTASAFTQYEEDNAGFKDPEIHALYRLLHQKHRGFTIDIFGSLAIGIQSAQRMEGDFQTNINYRGSAIPNTAILQQGNSSSGGSDLNFGIRTGRKHSPVFEYTLQADVTYKTARDYEVLRAYSQSSNFFTNLDYEEDAQFAFHVGGVAQFSLGDVAAVYLGGDFYFLSDREARTTYPSIVAQERMDIEALTGFGAKLGLKFTIVPKAFNIAIEGHYISFAPSETKVFVNNIESFRYQISNDANIGGKLQANIFF